MMKCVAGVIILFYANYLFAAENRRQEDQRPVTRAEFVAFKIEMEEFVQALVKSSVLVAQQRPVSNEATPARLVQQPEKDPEINKPVVMEHAHQPEKKMEMKEPVVMEHIQQSEKPINSMKPIERTKPEDSKAPSQLPGMQPLVQTPMVTQHATQDSPIIVQQIDNFRVLLFQAAPFQKEALQSLINDAPDMETVDKAAAQLYNESKICSNTCIGGGQDSQVHKVSSKIDRPEAGIVKGQAIALRTASFETTQECSSVLMTLRNFSRIQYLNKHCIEFYPAFYGSFKGQGIGKYNVRKFMHCQEMEFYPLGTLGKYYNVGADYYWRKPAPTIPNPVVFEYCLGEWASAYFAGVGNADHKCENFAMKECNYARRYNVSGYAFTIGHPFAPRRIDVGGAGIFIQPHAKLLTTFRCSIPTHMGTRITVEAKKFIDDLNSSNRPVFDVFAEFYAKFSSDEPVQEQVKEFIWPTLDGHSEVLPEYQY